MIDDNEVEKLLNTKVLNSYQDEKRNIYNQVKNHTGVHYLDAEQLTAKTQLKAAINILLRFGVKVEIS